MKSSPKYCFFRVIIGGEMIDIISFNHCKCYGKKSGIKTRIYLISTNKIEL